MSEREDSAEDRTHEASSHRLEKAREQGQFPQSRDLVTLLLLLGCAAGLYALGHTWLTQWVEMMRWTLQSAARADLQSVLHGWPFYRWVVELLALLGLLWWVAALMPLALVRFQPVFNLQWRPNKLDPIQGMGRVFSRRSVAEAGKNFLKTAAMLVLLMLWVRDWGMGLSVVTHNTLPPALALASQALGTVVVAILMIVTLMALLDVVMQWRLFQREMRMSTHDLREEQKETDGSPEIKQRQRQRRLEISRHRTLAAVEQADVLVTNPDHYAVALRYEAARMKSPQVIAKGTDAIAQQMKRVARRRNIPMTEAPPLARWMYHRLRVGQSVPPALFEAVAKVLAWAYEYRDAGYATRTLPDLGPMPSEF